MTLVKVGRQTLFRIIVTSIGTTAMWFASRKQIGLKFEYNQDKWDFVAREQRRGAVGEKITKRLGFSCLTDPTRFLLKAR